MEHRPQVGTSLSRGARHAPRDSPGDLFAVAACQPAATLLSDEDIAAIRSLDASYAQAILSEDADAIAALYAEDGIEMPPNAPANVGREIIRQWYTTSVFPVYDFDDFTITPGEIDGVNGLAFNRGTYSSTTVEGTSVSETVTGKYVVIARRQADGTWLWSVDIWNVDSPLPPTEGEHAEGDDHT